MKLNITYLGVQKGSLKIEQQGLYYLLQADCDLVVVAPQHLYGINGQQSRSLGVLSRDGKLTKKLSAQELGSMPEYAVIGREEGGFFPWCGEIENETVSDAYLKKEQEGELLALPVTEGGTLPLLAYAAQMTETTVCGRACLVLPLQNGAPLPLPEDDSEEMKNEEMNKEEVNYDGSEEEMKNEGRSEERDHTAEGYFDIPAFHPFD